MLLYFHSISDCICIWTHGEAYTGVMHLMHDAAVLWSIVFAFRVILFYPLTSVMIT